MKTVKYAITIFLLVLVVVTAQAQQSAFQGTWFGETNRSGDRLEISGNNWSYFSNNVIQSAGTAKFSTGKTELLLADGSLYFTFTFLAPGLIYYPGTGWGHYRFRLAQSNSNVQNNGQSSSQNLPFIRIRNNTGYTIYYVRISPVSNDKWGKDFLGDKVFNNGETLSFSLTETLIINNKYDIQLEDEDGDTYSRYNVQISSNTLIEFTIGDLDSNER